MQHQHVVLFFQPKGLLKDYIYFASEFPLSLFQHTAYLDDVALLYTTL